MAHGFALVGAGLFGERHAQAYSRHPAVDFAAVCDLDEARAKRLAETYGARRHTTRLDDILADPTIAAVSVATPDHAHRAVAVACAEAGKHILVEKPLATTVEDARAIVRACRRAGVALGTGYHLRHHPLHREARRLVAEGALGEIAAAEAEWSLSPSPPSASAPWRRDPALAGGGIVTGTGIHAIDLLRFVLGDEVESVSAFTDGARSPVSPLESRALALLSFRGGTLATVRCARGVHAPENDLYVQGVSGSLTAHRTIDEMTRGRLEVSGADSPISGVPAGSDMYALQARAFAEAVERGDEPDASGEDGLRLVEIATALYESARTGRTVAS